MAGQGNRTAPGGKASADSAADEVADSSGHEGAGGQGRAMTGANGPADRAGAGTIAPGRDLPLLQAEGLIVGREGRALLRGLDFRLMPGRALLLRGPNGVGKTTLLRILAGFIPLPGGRLTGAEPAWAGHLDGIKAQLTVAENLGFWARIEGGADIAPALAAFDLSDLQTRMARTLSAGQKRRLGLARLLLGGQSLWLLDEPTVSLDAASVRRLAAVIETHLARGGAALIATHADLGITADVLDLANYGLPGPVSEVAGTDAAEARHDDFGADW